MIPFILTAETRENSPIHQETKNCRFFSKRRNPSENIPISHPTFQLSIQSVECFATKLPLTRHSNILNSDQWLTWNIKLTSMEISKWKHNLSTSPVTREKMSHLAHHLVISCQTMFWSRTALSCNYLHPNINICQPAELSLSNTQPPYQPH